MKQKPIITICILHFNKLPELKKTIANLKRYTQVPFKIKLLNQEFINKPIKKYLTKINKEENINVIFGKKNLGCPAGRNKILKNIKTPYIITLDDDVYVHKNWLMPVINFLKNNQQAGAVSYYLYAPDGKLDTHGGRLVKLDEKKKTFYRKPLPINPKKTKKKFIEVDNINGGVMVFKKELMNYFQWDPRYISGMGDFDISLQINKNSDYKMYAYSKSRLIHDKVSQKMNRSEYNKVRRDYHKIRQSYLQFVKKWGYRYPFCRHIYYKYFCLLPNPITTFFAYIWLNYLKKAINQLYLSK